MKNQTSRLGPPHRRRRRRLPAPWLLRTGDLPPGSPDPRRRRDGHGPVLSSRARILDGQEVWQAIGGQQIGSIWGHGAYQAPDWSADWLHREALALLDVWSQDEHGAAFEALDADQRGALEARLKARAAPEHLRPRDGHAGS
jgi:nitric oxide reductase subunit B